MLSKRKFKGKFENVKKVKSIRSISSYIEEEREKMLLVSPRDLEKSINDYLIKLKYIALARFGLLPKSSKPRTIFMLPKTHFQCLLRLYEKFETNERPSTSEAYELLSVLTYEDFIEYNQPNFEATHNILWDSLSDFPEPTKADISMMTQLVSIVRDWNPVLHQQCMNNYNSIRFRNPEFWDTVILKFFPPVLLEHCTNSDIVADFFHSLCQNPKAISALVKIKSSYFKYFLMNMAKVNCLEYSSILDTDWGKSAKEELVRCAFVAGQVNNLQLLLQYFQVTDFWSRTDMDFMKFPGKTLESPHYGVDPIVEYYYSNFNSLNIVRVATYLSESVVPRSALTDCIRMLWRASVTPYVTLRDIRNAFEPLKQLRLLCHRLIRACYDPFIETYPRDCLMLDRQPRSLMHLSRCKIRQNLISAVYVSSLPLPDGLKAYINLEW